MDDYFVGVGQGDVGFVVVQDDFVFGIEFQVFVVQLCQCFLWQVLDVVDQQWLVWIVGDEYQCYLGVDVGVIELSGGGGCCQVVFVWVIGIGDYWSGGVWYVEEDVDDNVVQLCGKGCCGFRQMDFDIYVLIFWFCVVLVLEDFVFFYYYVFVGFDVDCFGFVDGDVFVVDDDVVVFFYVDVGGIGD